MKPGRRARDRRDGRQAGLFLSVLPSGKKQWTLRYRFAGKNRRMLLGEFPALGLKAARTRAVDELRAIDAGQDRALELRALKQRPTDTVDALVKEYLAEHAEKKKRTAAADRRMLEVDVVPYLGDRSVPSVTRRDVRAVLDRITKRGSLIAANRTLEVVRKMFNFGIRRDWLEHNPAQHIDKPGLERRRDRVLDDDELRAVWTLLERFPATEEKQAPNRVRATHDTEGRPFCPVSPALAAVLKTELLTAARAGEVARMRWADLELTGGWWTIPVEHSKNKRAHRLPLVAEAVALITKQEADEKKRGEYVFLGRKGALVEARVKKAGADISRALELKPGIRTHDLRRTVATRLGER